MIGKLYIVPTPIGILRRYQRGSAVKVLKSVDFILAEDTRTSIKLLKYLKISKKLYSYNMNNEYKNYQHITHQLITGKIVALISDAGTPAISDPRIFISSRMSQT